jgi:hypothetical protein
MDRFVERGIALKRSNTSASICEELVRQQLLSLSTPESLNQFEQSMVQYLDTDSVALAERAVALQLVKFRGTLKDLLKSWNVSNIPEEALEFFNEFTLNGFTVLLQFDTILLYLGCWKP